MASADPRLPRLSARPLAGIARSRSMSTFTHLVRFEAEDGKIYFGDAVLPAGAKDVSQSTSARVISGDVLGEYTVTDKILKTQRLLSPLAPSQTPSVRCIGLNYVKHAKEAKAPIPDRPVLFFKPNTALSGPFNDIPVPTVAQQGKGLDYEGELVIIIGRKALNVSKDEAEQYVLGYATGNDASHRDWQLKWGGGRVSGFIRVSANKTGQWGLGKCYDGWAPWGPAIVTKDGLPNQSLKGLRLSTTVNGEVKQSETLDDLIFNPAYLVSFLSQGVTLLPGDVIFTGTPAGVQFGQEKPVWLKDGDMVEVTIDGIGTIRNKMQFV